MSTQDSAYAALGLKPGASPANVDEAYRRLIKQHHPDRAGGDGNRAAEINRAYTLLRRQGRALAVRHPSVPVAVVRRRRPNRSAWLLLAASAILVVALSMTQSPAPQRVSIRLPADEWRTIGAAVTPTRNPLTDFEQPLHTPLIDGAIAEALKFHSGEDSAGAAQYSRDCHNRLRQQPNLAWFDSCAAFDEATVTLAGDESMQFTVPAVIGREMAASRSLSDDVLGADSRLQKIRLRVEMQLLPALDSAASQKL